MEKESPDQILIQRAKKKLSDQKLLEDVDIEALVKTILTGHIKSQDWKLNIENSIERRKKNESSEEN